MIKKDFSLLMTVYYKEKPGNLRESIESALHNTIPPSEFVIVKDGELTPQLESVLGVYMNNPIFKIIGYKKNKGAGLASRLGVENCKYDLIARLDSDDICDVKRFEKELNFLINNPEYGIVGSNTIQFADNVTNVVNRKHLPENDEEIRKFSKRRNPFITSSIMMYKKFIFEAGGYQDCYLCEDYDLWTRMLALGTFKAYNFQENLVFMRVDKNFYKRRGGLKYCKAICKFKKRLYKSGYMSYKDYFITKNSTIIVSLMPGFLREWIYKGILSK